MNVIWVVADTFRRDHMGAYGNPTIQNALPGCAGGQCGPVRPALFRRVPDHAHQGGPPDGALDHVLHGMAASACCRDHAGGDTGRPWPSHGGGGGHALLSQGRDEL